MLTYIHSVRIILQYWFRATHTHRRFVQVCRFRCTYACMMCIESNIRCRQEFVFTLLTDISQHQHSIFGTHFAYVQSCLRHQSTWITHVDCGKIRELVAAIRSWETTTFWFDLWFPMIIKDGSGGSYRLPSLDRLASRQRILEQNGGDNGFASLADKPHATNNGNGGGSVGGHSNGSVPYSVSTDIRHKECRLTGPSRGHSYNGADHRIAPTRAWCFCLCLVWLLPLYNFATRFSCVRVCLCFARRNARTIFGNHHRMASYASQ